MPKNKPLFSPLLGARPEFLSFALKNLYADTVEDDGPSYAMVAVEEIGSTPKLVLVTKKNLRS